jgi:hypothetical protein
MMMLVGAVLMVFSATALILLTLGSPTEADATGKALAWAGVFAFSVALIIWGAA